MPSVSDALASLEHDPLPAEFLAICKDAGLPLRVVGDRVEAPKGITGRIAELIEQHNLALVTLIGTKDDSVKPAANGGSNSRLPRAAKE